VLQTVSREQARLEFAVGAMDSYSHVLWHTLRAAQTGALSGSSELPLSVYCVAEHAVQYSVSRRRETKAAPVQRAEVPVPDLAWPAPHTISSAQTLSLIAITVLAWLLNSLVVGALDSYWVEAVHAVSISHCRLPEAWRPVRYCVDESQRV
jgi:hypothetical protein